MNMSLATGLPWLVTLTGILTLVALILVGVFLLHRNKERRLKLNGLERFITCSGQERWGTRDLISRWRSQATLHIAAELSRIQHEIWQIRHKIENLREMEVEVRKKQAELKQSLAIAKKRKAWDSMQFTGFEIRESENKMAGILRRIDQNERKLRVIRRIMIEKKECLVAYKSGKNPGIKLSRKVRAILTFPK
jgi:hypothetical protein